MHMSFMEGKGTKWPKTYQLTKLHRSQKEQARELISKTLFLVVSPFVK